VTAHPASAGLVRLKRAYEPAAPEDGVRVLVDRLWPRGIRKEDAAIDQRMKKVVPSSALRRWFGNDPSRWPEFCRRYAEELHAHAKAIEALCDLARKGTITLVSGAHNEERNDAVMPRDILLKT